ncbi:MFS general substrate transporter [Patellaria atrata CBS 101060]|uniref:MFS general substrate transporter n=1 Tax=Patellaria atrata CBS 101060 TaxID=1346257 RepID=A0A9P4S6F7_9PEZI|nr:MFS general substrate transporter [Patellaria atrata CBS 101060]
MQDGAPFAAEERVSGLRPEFAGSSSGHNTTGGENVVTATTGGLHPFTGKQNWSEETPLLPKNGSLSGDNESVDEEEWDGRAYLDQLPWYKRPSIYWVVPPYIIAMLAFGGIIVPKINLILELICKQYLAEQVLQDPNMTIMPVVFGGENPQCRIPEVQSRVSQFTLYGNLIMGILCALTSPKLGALSDRYGRKPILLLSSAGLLATEVVTIIAGKYPDQVSVDWILFGYAIDGICGSFITSMALSYAYATDCTPPANRNVAFGYFHGSLFTGIAVGPIIAAYVVKCTGSILSIFYVALGAHLSFMLFLALLIPESLSKSRQHEAREKHRAHREAQGPSSDWINQLRHINLIEPLKVLYPTGEGSSPALRRNLLLLAGVDFTIFGIAMSAMTVVVIYSNFQFGWTTFESSRFVSIVNACRVSCLLLVLPLVTRIFHKRRSNPHGNMGSDLLDLSIIRIAVFFDTLAYLGYTVSRTGLLFTISGVIGGIGGMASPTITSALTKHVSSNQTGQLLGATGLLHACARIIAPTIFQGIYSVTVGKFTQTVFLCLTVTFAVAFTCTWFVKPHGEFQI